MNCKNCGQKIDRHKRLLLGKESKKVINNLQLRLLLEWCPKGVKHEFDKESRFEILIKKYDRQKTRSTGKTKA